MRATRLFPRLFIGLLPALLLSPSAHALHPDFSVGMRTPQTISPAPAGFGVFAGHYLVPDIATSLPGKPAAPLIVWAVPESGGPPVVFSTGYTDTAISGLFLPSTPEWGANAGKFLTSGRAFVTVGTENIITGFVHTYDETGARTLFGSYPHAPFSQVLLAPTGFGAIAGKLVVSEVEQFGRIDVLSPDGTLQEGFFDTTLIGQAFGLAFAPTEFGSFDGQLLVSDAFTGKIVAVDTAGTATPFTTVDLLAGQTGLRQMAFAPTDFLIDLGIPGDLLMVSVAGSSQGGGTLGDVLAVNSSGAVVASLRVIDDLDAFDPRGMFFRSDGSLLVSDTSDPIILAGAVDFQLGRFANVAAAPEPPVLLLLAVGFAGLLAARRR